MLFWLVNRNSLFKYFQIVIIWYICSIKRANKVMTKVIHVHLIFEKKNYYFGSISAIFDTLSEEEVGITRTASCTPE